MMKRIIQHIFLCLIATVACQCNSGVDIDKDHEPEEKDKSLAESIIGEWIYDSPEEQRWEYMKFTPGGVLFYSTRDIAWSIKERNSPIRYAVDGATISGTYDINGVTMYLNMTVSQINEYSFTARFNDTGLQFTYAKLLDSIKIKPSETYLPDYSQLVQAKIIGFESHKPTIATVNSITGEITAISSGTTYINVITEEGTAVVEIISFDEEDMFGDFSYAFGMTVPEIVETFGGGYLDIDNETGISYSSDNYAFDYIKFYTGVYDNTHIEFIILYLNDNVSRTQILNSLNNQYSLISDNGIEHSFITNMTVNDMPVILIYDESTSEIRFMVLEPDGLWKDFKELFGMEKKNVKTYMQTLGLPFFASSYSYSVDGSDFYEIKDNDYAEMVEFVYNPDNKVCEYWIYLKLGFNKVNVLYALSSKYELSESESFLGHYIFYDKGHRQRIMYDFEGMVNYVDSKQTPFVPVDD